MILVRMICPERFPFSFMVDSFISECEDTNNYNDTIIITKELIPFGSKRLSLHRQHDIFTLYEP